MQIVRKVTVLGCMLLSRCGAAQSPPTAADVWHQIQQFYGATLSSDTVDTLKAGDPTTAVTGIATTFLDTMAVLREAAARGDNLVITHEPTFYNHRDETAALQHDPVYREKLAFIEQNHMVVYRLHDGIHFSRSGDHIVAGLYTALGWQSYPHPPGPLGPYFVTLPPTTLEELALFLRTRLHAQTIRVVGNPALRVTHAAILPGSAGLSKQVLALNQPGTDVLIAGEASEWETVEYVRDAAAQGRPRALILLGHEVSEEAGMAASAQELRQALPGIQIDHISAGQALWNPDLPPPAK